MLNFPRKHPLISGGVIGGLSLLWLLWGNMPRTTYLSQGCQLQPTGMIAAVFGNVFVVLAHALSFAGGYVIGMCVVFALQQLGIGVYRAYKSLRRWSRQRKERANAPKQPKSVKPTVTFSNGDKYARFFPAQGPGFVVRTWVSFQRTFLDSAGELTFTVIVAFLFFWLLLIGPIKENLCIESTGQGLAFAAVLLVLWAVSSAVVSWAWLTLSPRKKAMDELDKLYGNRDAFVGGVLTPEQTAAFSVRDLLSLDNDDILVVIDRLDVILHKYTKQVTGDCKYNCRLAHFDNTLNYRIWLNDNEHNTLVRFRAVVKANGLLTVGVLDDNQDFVSGIILHIPVSTSIENFIHGSASIMKDFVQTLPEALEVILASKQNTSSAVQKHCKKKKNKKS